MMNANDSTQHPLPPERSRDSGHGDHGLSDRQESLDPCWLSYPLVGASGGTFWAGLGGHSPLKKSAVGVEDALHDDEVFLGTG